MYKLLGSVRKTLFEANVRVEVKNNTIHLKFDNLLVELSKLLDNSERRIRNRPGLPYFSIFSSINLVVKYYECAVENIEKISHDTYIYHVATPEGVHLPIPLGHHVSVKAKQGCKSFYKQSNVQL